MRCRIGIPSYAPLAASTAGKFRCVSPSNRVCVLAMQSGRFDHSDRLFSSMHKSWLVASGGLSGSVQVRASAHNRAHLCCCPLPSAFRVFHFHLHLL
jgi:hypothetical protein